MDNLADAVNRLLFRFTFTAVGMLCGVQWTRHGSLRVKLSLEQC